MDTTQARRVAHELVNVSRGAEDYERKRNYADVARGALVLRIADALDAGAPPQLVADVSGLLLAEVEQVARG